MISFHYDICHMSQTGLPIIVVMVPSILSMHIWEVGVKMQQQRCLFGILYIRNTFQHFKIYASEAGMSWRNSYTLYDLENAKIAAAMANHVQNISTSGVKLGRGRRFKRLLVENSFIQMLQFFFYFSPSPSLNR